MQPDRGPVDFGMLAKLAFMKLRATTSAAVAPCALARRVVAVNNSEQQWTTRTSNDFAFNNRTAAL
jgi:hypothetical protein